MNPPFSKIWIIVIVITLLAGGIFAWQYFEKQKEAKKTSYETARLTVEEIENSDDLVSFLKDFASQKNIDAHWVSVSPECVSYLPWDNYVWDDKSYLSVELRERHNETCAGDPNVAPRLETFLYDKEEKRIFVLDVLSGLIPFDAYIQSHATVLDETADWQTYRNEEFGFEIKHPEEWNLEITGVTDPVFRFSGEEGIVVVLPRGSEVPVLENLGVGENAQARLTNEDEDRATEFHTEEGKVFGYSIRFNSIPSSWESFGSIQGQANLKSVQKREPVGVNAPVSAEVDEYGIAVIRNILSTFRFVEPGSSSGAFYTLASSDGFSLQVYEDGALYAGVTRAQIENEFKQKYPAASLGIEHPGFRYVGSSPAFFWDQKRGRVIFPIAFEQISGSSRTWEFFVFEVNSKEFSIIPEKRSFPHSGIVPYTFKLSPDGNKFAYIAGGAGGTCVLSQDPDVLDLATLKFVELDESEIQARDAYQSVEEVRMAFQ